MEETPQRTQSEEEEHRSDDVSQLTGRVIDQRYRLDAHLGGGGMGEVYRAEHTMMHKTVAVKLLRPDVADDESVIERFRREAAAAANLNHPNICAATDFGKTENGLFFLVMEYVEGESLKEVLERRGALPVDEVVRIADGIAAALEKADELDVVHRDIKPDNVMLVEDASGPYVKVLDFGVAHVEFNDEMPSLTKTGAVFGTPSYMSPEQATGDEVGHGADLYGLGVVIYEMLTGREVFDADESAQLMAKHIMEEPEPPSTIRNRDEIPAPIDDLVMELLEKKPEHRPASATHVRDRLRDSTDAHLERRATSSRSDRPTRAPEAPTAGLVTRLRRRTTELLEDLTSGDLADRPINLALLGLAGLLAVIVTVLVAATLYLWLGASAGETRESLQAQRATFRKRAEIKEALAPMENGRPADALRNLQKLRERRGAKASPHLHYLAATAYETIGNERRALESFRAAVDADPRYIYDPKLLDHVVEALSSNHRDLVDSARQFVRTYGDREPLRDRVATLAWKSDSGDVRDRAYEFLESRQLLGSIPEWQRLSIEMRRADRCAAWKRKIAALVDLGDPRGAEILRIYQDKPRRGCGPPIVKFKDCYKCIRDELASGIESLEKETD